MEMINASGKIGINVIMKLIRENSMEKECQKIGRVV